MILASQLTREKLATESDDDGDSVTLCMKTTSGFYADSVLTADKDD